jgi:rod shape determining protein RodA
LVCPGNAGRRMGKLFLTHRPPWLLLAAGVVLVGLGWMAIARCEELSGGSGRFLRQQMIWSAVAAVAALVVAVPNYRVLARWSYIFLAITVVLLVLVNFSPPINGARRWLRLGLLGIQPSEFAKVAFVLGVARCLRKSDRGLRLRDALVSMGIMLLPAVLILREPDLGTAMVFPPTLLLLLWTAGARRRTLAGLALIGLLVVPLLWTQMSREQKSRVTTLFQQPGPGDAVTSDTYQLHQARQVAALGNVWGSLVLGPAVEDPGAYHLPEARSDFIFCVLTERLGLPGGALVLGLYAVFLGQGLAIATATKEPFGRLAAVGLSGLVAVQVLINTGMNVGLLPVTGLSLPLVSYGGSGLVANAMLVGLLANIGLRPGYEVAPEPFRYALS